VGIVIGKIDSLYNIDIMTLPTRAIFFFVKNQSIIVTIVIIKKWQDEHLFRTFKIMLRSSSSYS